jgi:hypothetical protein
VNRLDLFHVDELRTRRIWRTSRGFSQHRGLVGGARGIRTSVPLGLTWVEFGPILAHYSAPNKSIHAGENLFAGVRSPLRISPVPFVRQADARNPLMSNTRRRTTGGASQASLRTARKTTTSARARSKAADSNDGSTGDELGRARARRFDGAARWLPTPPARLKRNTRLRRVQPFVVRIK